MSRAPVVTIVSEVQWQQGGCQAAFPCEQGKEFQTGITNCVIIFCFFLPKDFFLEESHSVELFISSKPWSQDPKLESTPGPRSPCDSTPSSWRRPPRCSTRVPSPLPPRPGDRSAFNKKLMGKRIIFCYRKCLENKIHGMYFWGGEKIRNTYRNSLKICFKKGFKHK